MVLGHRVRDLHHPRMGVASPMYDRLVNPALSVVTITTGGQSMAADMVVSSAETMQRTAAATPLQHPTTAPSQYTLHLIDHIP